MHACLLLILISRKRHKVNCVHPDLVQTHPHHILLFHDSRRYLNLAVIPLDCFYSTQSVVLNDRSDLNWVLSDWEYKSFLICSRIWWVVKQLILMVYSVLLFKRTLHTSITSSLKSTSKFWASYSDTIWGSNRSCGGFWFCSNIVVGIRKYTSALSIQVDGFWEFSCWLTV